MMMMIVLVMMMIMPTWVEDDDVQLWAEEYDKADHRREAVHTNTNIQIHKYTNTQIQHMTKCQKDPTCAIFFKRGLFKDIKNDISVCQKIQNTNTKYTNTAYDEVPERPNKWYIFEKRIVHEYQK